MRATSVTLPSQKRVIVFCYISSIRTQGNIANRLRQQLNHASIYDSRGLLYEKPGRYNRPGQQTVHKCAIRPVEEVTHSICGCRNNNYNATAQSSRKP